MLMLQLIYVLFFIQKINTYVVDSTSQNATQDFETIDQELKTGPSLGTAIVNTQILTMFNYQGSQIYIYNALSNEKENFLTPQRWVFYFVPIMQPVVTNASMGSWAFTYKNDIRINLMLSNEHIQELARAAIVKKYDSNTSQYSAFWDIAPLMIDSLTAYIVRGSGIPVEGVHPYKAVHPNQLTMQFRFVCSSDEHAQKVVELIIDDVYEIEIAFYFAGFKQVTTNMIAITSDQLKNVLSKTIADGGNKNPQYIHRNQGSEFVSKYVANVKKMIYLENMNSNVSSLSNGLEDQFISLLQQGMAFSEETKLDTRLYDQIWSPSDLNPDRITSELSKLFTHNQGETQRHNYSENFFDFNQAYAQSSSAAGGGGLNVFGLFSVGGNGGSSSSSSGHLLTTTQTIFSESEIQNFLAQESIETAWTGEKFIPKSFHVYKLTDITDRLQVAIIAKQLIAEKTNGAIVRTVNIRSSASATIDLHSRPLVGEIRLYSGNQLLLPRDWIFCHGQALSRFKYRRLFFVIGNTYGEGNGVTTFNVPDFRGRFPLGVNVTENQMARPTTGGSASQRLTVDHLPAHQHAQGTLYTSNAGTHSHSVNDPGHNHGGQTDSKQGGSGRWNLKSNGAGSFDDGATHAHTIPRGTTGIGLSSDGAHSHVIGGSTSATGRDQSFSIMPPYQSVHYIIFTGDN